MLEPMPDSRDRILANLAAIRETVSRAAGDAGRDPQSVCLVAAAKTVPPDVTRWVVDAGVTAIGHNYVKELRAAVGSSALAGHPVRWHFIGSLQSGTAHLVADLADVVETVSGERAARRLAGRAVRDGKTVDVLLEIDFTGVRSGLAPDDAAAAADSVSSLEGLRLMGLMTIPPPTPTAEEARPWFAGLRDLRDRLRENHPDLLELSMGMSLDYPVAVEEGATMVRIGTALFGPRTP
jgi:pyridoxal phosphate enzyme (YggS family)